MVMNFDILEKENENFFLNRSKRFTFMKENLKVH